MGTPCAGTKRYCINTVLDRSTRRVAAVFNPTDGASGG